MNSALYKYVLLLLGEGGVSWHGGYVGELRLMNVSM